MEMDNFVSATFQVNNLIRILYYFLFIVLMEYFETNPKCQKTPIVNISTKDRGLTPCQKTLAKKTVFTYIYTI